MTNTFHKLNAAGLSLLATAMLPAMTQAECNCSKGGGQSYSHSAPIASSMQYSGMQYSGYPQMQYTAATPPGTLGRTYNLPSREVPAEKHPRTGMVDVIVSGATHVAVYNINPHREEDAIDGFENQRTDGLWQFETKPLFPGVPHLYKVVFRFSDAPNAPESVRYIRMIPGRIVQITY